MLTSVFKTQVKKPNISVLLRLVNLVFWKFNFFKKVK